MLMFVTRLRQLHATSLVAVIKAGVPPTSKTIDVSQRFRTSKGKTKANVV